MIYQPGERVALVHTNDEYTHLRPGELGTVRRHDHGLRTVEIDWDNGSRLSIVFDAGDRIRPVTEPAPTRVADGPADGDGRSWQQLLATVRAAGTEAGRHAAERWAEDTIGAGPGGDSALTARRILAGIDDRDPDVLQSLPTVYSGDDAERIADGDVYTAAGGTAQSWPALTGWQHDEVGDAYRDGFDTAVEDEVTARCRAVGSPTGDGRDLSHLHPDRLRIGSVGVFTGDWAWTTDANGQQRIPLGFVGTLVDTWNGWAVFTCTRPVAEAIVADQQHQRDLHRQGLREQGVPETDLDARTDAEMTSLTFDGDTIVADQRALSDDPEAIERIEPDAEGRYVVMGWNWCWEAVEPTDCDRIVGDLPAAGEHQQFVILPHTGMRVPHDRFRVTALTRRSTRTRVAFTADLECDGNPAGVIVEHGNGGGSELHPTSTQFGSEAMAAYVRDCRFHAQPVSEGQVLDALVAEYDLTVRTRRAGEGGGVLVRLIDDCGHILHVLEVWPAPDGHQARVNLGRHLNAAHPLLPGAFWQIWSGTAWRYLAQAGAPTPEGDRGDTDVAGAVDAMRVFAYVIADALLDDLTREQLITHAAQHGIPLDPQMTDARIRAMIRYHLGTEARRAGLPVDNLPRLPAGQGLEPGRRLTGGTTPDDPTTPHEPPQAPTSR